MEGKYALGEPAPGRAVAIRKVQPREARRAAASAPQTAAKAPAAGGRPAKPPPARRVAPAAAAPALPPERFLVKKLGKEFLLPVDELEWVQACGNYVNLHRRQHDYPLRSTLAAMERRLDPARFVRVHRSYLVNLALVDAIEPTKAGDARLRMRDGGFVPCSRTHLESLRSRLR